MRPSFNNILFTITGLLFSFQLPAQNAPEDLSLISTVDFSKQGFEKRDIRFMLPQSDNPVLRYNPVSLFFGSLMYVYQGAFSPQISAQCRFSLSCSAFSRECIREYGLVKGIALSADRIMRCNRIAVLDVHPADFNTSFLVIDSPIKYRINH